MVSKKHSSVHQKPTTVQYRTISTSRNLFHLIIHVHSKVRWIKSMMTRNLNTECLEKMIIFNSMSYSKRKVRGCIIQNHVTMIWLHHGDPGIHILKTNDELIKTH